MSMSESDNHCRLFFALVPDQATRNRMGAIQRHFNSDRARWTTPDKLHATLVFLGDIEAVRVAAVIEAASGLRGRPFHLLLDYVRFITRSEMLWLTPGQVPDELRVLVNGLTTRLQSCGFEPDARRFRPHVTLARTISGKPDRQDIDPIDWPVESFALVESKTDNNGSHYIVREVWRLA